MQLRQARHRLRHHFRHIRRILGHHAPWRLPHLDPLQVGQKFLFIDRHFLFYFYGKYRQASDTLQVVLVWYASLHL